jgi:hypothetical protein
MELQRQKDRISTSEKLQGLFSWLYMVKKQENTLNMQGN